MRVGAADDGVGAVAEIHVVRLEGEHPQRAEAGEHLPRRLVEIGEGFTGVGYAVELVPGDARSDVEKPVALHPVVAVGRLGDGRAGQQQQRGHRENPAHHCTSCCHP
jgi:hypothetical protein